MVVLSILGIDIMRVLVEMVLVMADVATSIATTNKNNVNDDIDYDNRTHENTMAMRRGDAFLMKIFSTATVVKITWVI